MYARPAHVPSSCPPCPPSVCAGPRRRAVRVGRVQSQREPSSRRERCRRTPRPLRARHRPRRRRRPFRPTRRSRPTTPARRRPRRRHPTGTTPARSATPTPSWPASAPPTPRPSRPSAAASGRRTPAPTACMADPDFPDDTYTVDDCLTELDDRQRRVHRLGRRGPVDRRRRRADRGERSRRPVVRDGRYTLLVVRRQLTTAMPTLRGSRRTAHRGRCRRSRCTTRRSAARPCRSSTAPRRRFACSSTPCVRDPPTTCTSCTRTSA